MALMLCACGSSRGWCLVWHAGAALICVRRWFFLCKNHSTTMFARRRSESLTSVLSSANATDHFMGVECAGTHAHRHAAHQGAPPKCRPSLSHLPSRRQALWQQGGACKRACAPTCRTARTGSLSQYQLQMVVVTPSRWHAGAGMERAGAHPHGHAARQGAAAEGRVLPVAGRGDAQLPPQGRHCAGADVYRRHHVSAARCKVWHETLAYAAAHAAPAAGAQSVWTLGSAHPLA